MKQVLFAYTSNDGQTHKILQYITKQLGEDVNINFCDLRDGTISLDFTIYDYILISSSIRYGKYAKEFYNFINFNKVELEKANAEFMSVNLTARKEGKDVPETSSYIKKFVKKSKWTPAKITMFAGLLDYPKYGPIDKRMIQFIMHITGGETNTSKTVEYTDWKKVDIFANRIKEQLK